MTNQLRKQETKSSCAAKLPRRSYIKLMYIKSITNDTSNIMHGVMDVAEAARTAGPPSLSSSYRRKLIEATDAAGHCEADQ